MSRDKGRADRGESREGRWVAAARYELASGNVVKRQNGEWVAGGWEWDLEPTMGDYAELAKRIRDKGKESCE
jgi:hypothetical protein